MPETETTYITYTLGVDVDPANADAIISAARQLDDHDEPLTLKNAIAVLVNHGKMDALAGAGHRGGWECYPADGWDTEPAADNTDSVKLPCPTHGLTDHRLVVRTGFTPYRECVACTDFPATPAGFAAAQAAADRVADEENARIAARATKPAVVIITDDAEVEIHPTPDVDVFVYPCEETADDLRRDADTLEARGLIEAARTLRRMAAGEA